MNTVITYDKLRQFTYSNDLICVKPIKGIVLSFMGLGKAGMFHEDDHLARFYAEKGIIYLIPYNNPWAWMNRQAVRGIPMKS